MASVPATETSKTIGSAELSGWSGRAAYPRMWKQCRLILALAPLYAGALLVTKYMHQITVARCGRRGLQNPEAYRALHFQIQCGMCEAIIYLWFWLVSLDMLMMTDRLKSVVMLKNSDYSQGLCTTLSAVHLNKAFDMLATTGPSTLISMIRRISVMSAGYSDSSEHADYIVTGREISHSPRAKL